MDCRLRSGGSAGGTFGWRLGEKCPEKQDMKEEHSKPEHFYMHTYIRTLDNAQYSSQAQGLNLRRHLIQVLHPSGVA